MRFWVFDMTHFNLELFKYYIYIYKSHWHAYIYACQWLYLVQQYFWKLEKLFEKLFKCNVAQSSQWKESVKVGKSNKRKPTFTCEF